MKDITDISRAEQLAKIAKDYELEELTVEGDKVFIKRESNKINTREIDFKKEELALQEKIHSSLRVRRK